MTARFDWFQTEESVTITIPKRGVNISDCIVNSEGRRVTVIVADEVIFDELLSSDFNTAAISLNATRAMVELKLPKTGVGRWPTLIAVKEVKKTTSSKNWDKIEKEATLDEDDDSLEGDAAVNKMFKKLFEDGSDEVKKAMMKSYQESGGTVLSTNWEEIRKKRTEVKPPDCMEYKRFEQ